MSDEENVSFLEAFFFGKTYETSKNATIGYWGPPTGINWCEQDYVHSFYVAETYNTFSNISFILAGIAAYRTCNRLKLPTRFYMLSYTLILLGLTSGSFHCTLLWTHQKLDETFENIALVGLYHSQRASQVIPLLHSLIVALGVFTITFFLFCEVHLIGIVLLTLVKVKNWIDAAHEILQGKEGKAGLMRAVKVSVISIVLGCVCWVTDRLMCSAILHLPWWMPQLHAVWHLCCGIALHEAFVLAVALFQLNEKLEGGLETRQGKPEHLSDLSLPLVQPGRFGLDYVIPIKLKQ